MPSFRELLAATKSEIREVTPGLATGWGNLDRVVRVPEGAMTVVAGRPSHGKTVRPVKRT